jgi:hypothetical protein
LRRLHFKTEGKNLGRATVTALDSIDAAALAKEQPDRQLLVRQEGGRDAKAIAT